MRWSCLLLGLTLEQSTHLPTLNNELEKLDKQYKELTANRKTRYCLIDRFERLKGQLSQKVPSIHRHRLMLVSGTHLNDLVCSQSIG